MKEGGMAKKKEGLEDERGQGERGGGRGYKTLVQKGEEALGGGGVDIVEGLDLRWRRSLR